MKPSKSLKMLNFLDRKIKLTKDKHSYEGEVFYFSEKVIIIKTNINTF